jgi:mono/diheme cytochrome c family protein
MMERNDPMELPRLTLSPDARYPHVAVAIVLGVLLSLGQGCARAPVPDYVLSETTLALPQRHQRQIERGLIQLFGTPLSPRRLTISDDAEEDAQDANEESGDELAAEEHEEEADESESAVGAAAGNDDHELEFDVAFRDDVEPSRLRSGAEVYRARCAGCHGVSGDGNGEAAAFLLPRPRDYRRGIYKFTSTPYGMKPSRSDLVRTIRRGAKGTSMPAFPRLSDENLNDVIDYIILLSQRGEVEFSLAMAAESDYDEDEDLDPAEFVDALASVQESWG